MTTLAPLAQAGNFRFTFFERNNRAVGSRHETTWSAFCDWLIKQSQRVVVSKDALPLIKLATFKNDHRSDADIETVYGIEGDYDGGTIQPNMAVELLRAAGIEALVHTTPSSQPDKPRWRVLAPLSRSTSPAERRALVGRLNGVLGGILAPESLTASQPFYVGGLDGGSSVQCWPVEGRPIDTIEGLSTIVQGDQRQPSCRHPLRSPALAAPSFEAAVMALNSYDPNSINRDKWISITSAFKQAISSLTDDATAKFIWSQWCGRYDQNDIHENNKQWNSIQATTIGWTALRDNSPARAQLLFGDPSQPQSPQQPHPLIGYENIVATAHNESGKNTLIETVKLLHGNIDVAFDKFSETIIVRKTLPWDRTGPFPRPWKDLDNAYGVLFANASSKTPSKELMLDAVRMIADRHQFHSVIDYLDTLKWDGIERLPSMLTQYFGAVQSIYHAKIGMKFMIGAVARVRRPGCKVDNTLVLEGRQGIQKSTSIRVLAGDDWFTDELPDLHNKDAAIQLNGKWIVEISELSALKRADVETIKKFMSRTTDRYRAPYERIAKDVWRQSVLVATTNDEGYMKDQTGNRRFWPVKCSNIDIVGLRRDRDQLWAEAKVRFDRGETWWLDAMEEQLAQIEQEERREIDPWEERISNIVHAMGDMPISIEQIAVMMGVQFDKQNTLTNKRIVSALRRNGYIQRQVRDGGRRVRQYVRANL